MLLEAPMWRQSGGLIFFPLLFLTPNFVPRDMLARPLEIAPTVSPVTYVMEALRSPILAPGIGGGPVGKGFAVVAVVASWPSRSSRRWRSTCAISSYD